MVNDSSITETVLIYQPYSKADDSHFNLAGTFKMAETTSTPTRSPAFESGAAIVGYIFGTIALFLLLMCICLIVRKRRWRPARKYIKKQSERSIGYGPRLDGNQNESKGSVSLKQLSNGSQSKSSNGKIKPPKQPRPLAQSIKMERLNIRRDAKLKKQAIKNAKKGLSNGIAFPYATADRRPKSSSRPTSANSVISVESSTSSSETPIKSLRTTATKRHLELPSLDPIFLNSGSPQVGRVTPRIRVTHEDETHGSPTSGRHTIECEVHVHTTRSNAKNNNDSQPHGGARSKTPISSPPVSAEVKSRPGSAQRNRLTPLTPDTGRSSKANSGTIRSSASSPALHSLIKDHSDIEEVGEDNPCYLNTTEL